MRTGQTDDPVGGSPVLGKTAWRTGLLAVIAAAGIAGGASASTAALTPHRAVYDLSLDEAEERSGIIGMAGRMVYELDGSACDGFTVNFRFVTRIETEEFSRVMDQRTTTYEDLDAGTFRFVNRSFVNDALDRETSGEARRGVDGSISVDLEKPEAKALTLDPGKFPSVHMLELIDRAEAGERFYQSHIYDGSEEGDQVMLTTTVVGAAQQPDGDDSEALADPSLTADEFWPVTMAYFDETVSGDGTPDYQISFKLHRGGVTRDLVMDYGEFKLRGTLADLEMLDAPECDG